MPRRPEIVPPSRLAGRWTLHPSGFAYFRRMTDWRAESYAPVERGRTPVPPDLRRRGQIRQIPSRLFRTPQPIAPKKGVIHQKSEEVGPPPSPPPRLPIHHPSPLPPTPPPPPHL